MATEVISVIDPNSGAGYDYTSLNAWEAGEQGDLTGVRDEIAVAKCRCTGGTADTTSCTVASWTASPTQYIKIWTDPAEGYRHNGTYQTGNKYRMEVPDAYAYNLNVQVRYTKVIGIQIGSGDGGYSLYQLDVGGNEQVYDKIIIRGGGTSNANGHGFKILGGQVRNCIAYNIYTGFTRDPYYYTDTYNCTAVDCAVGFAGVQNDQRSKAKNCLAFGCTTAFANPSYWDQTNSGYNASDDDNAADLPGSSNQIGVASGDFANYAGDNFHLASGASVIGDGADLSGTFSDDIDGETRSAWDIGADEYVAAGPSGNPSLDERGTLRGMMLGTMRGMAKRVM